MFRAMAMKEFREIRGIALVALALYGLILWVLIPQLLKWQPQTIPFVTDGFIVAYIWVPGGLAIAFGLRQSFGESVAGTHPFLFHRPASRQWLIGMKLLVGTTMYLICGASSDLSLWPVGVRSRNPRKPV